MNGPANLDGRWGEHGGPGTDRGADAVEDLAGLGEEPVGAGLVAGAAGGPGLERHGPSQPDGEAQLPPPVGRPGERGRRLLGRAGGQGGQPAALGPDRLGLDLAGRWRRVPARRWPPGKEQRSEEHTSELQSLTNLVCRLLLEKK